MKFEVSERIRTSRSEEEILAALEVQFRKISDRFQRSGKTLEARSIEASFGSINRNDSATITLRAAERGWLMLADVTYKPSGWFWVILIITLFTWVFWLIPIAFYLVQKDTVRTAIAEAFTRVRNEFDESNLGDSPARAPHTALDDLERLATLREKGLLTEEEFTAKKKQLLAL